MLNKNIKKIADIYCIGKVANVATKILIEKKCDELKKHFSTQYLDFSLENVKKDNEITKKIIENLIDNNNLDYLKSFIMTYVDKRNNKNIHIPNHNLINKENKLAIFDVNKGGILTTLWIISEATNSGLLFNQKDIPIRQEIIEFADFYDINPYRLRTNETKLLLINNEIVFNNVIDNIIDNLFSLDYDDKIILKNNYIKKIGVLTTGNIKQRLDVEQKSYLTKDYKDELDKICLEEK